MGDKRRSLQKLRSNASGDFLIYLVKVLFEFKVRVNEDTKVFDIILLFNIFVIYKYGNGFSDF